MTPLVVSKEVVIVAPVEENTELSKGDIVLVKVKKKVYLHLINKVAHHQYQIGSNKGRINGWVAREAIYGKMVGRPA